MHKNILTDKQIDLLPVIQKFSKDFYLAGGTAIALYIGHRRSIDFDLFSNSDIKRKRIRKILEKSGFPVSEIIYEAYDQIHLIVNDVKLTFFNFPYNVEHKYDFDGFIKIPSLLDLASLKAYALGGRAKWKDYVDLYFLLKDHFSIEEISSNAKRIFGKFFNEKLFREQLAFFKDIDYRESIEFMIDEVDEDKIQDYLTQISLSPF